MTYFELLEHWNRTINLTSLRDPDAAMDRLLIEPIAASAYLPARPRLMHARVAKRQLIEFAATQAVTVATQRIKQTITPDDQARLVDRYASQLQESHS